MLIGRPLRAAILFICILALFLTGLGIGGVFTVNPRSEPWWHYAQLGAGAPGLLADLRQRAAQADYTAKAIELEGRFKADPGSRAPLTAQKRIWQARVTQRIEALQAADKVALTYPASNPAVIFSAVAGLLNIMCIIDATILCMLGAFSEPVDGKSPEVGE